MTRPGLHRHSARPQAGDWGLAALFALPSLAQVLLDPITDRPTGVLVALWSTLPVAFRRSRPGLAALAGTAVWLVPLDSGYLYLGFFLPVVLYFSVGAYLASGAAVGAVVAWGLGVGTWSVLRSDQPPHTLLVVLLAVVASTVAGRMVAQHRNRSARLADLAARLAEERARVEEMAVSRERVRIARELHDVVGHDVTVIALQAEAAAAALAADPRRAQEPIEVIRSTCGRTLHEMRRVLAGLRADGDPGGEGFSPAAGPDDVVRLVEEARALGDEVELVVEGRSVAEPASIGLAVYRIVQESLTNARRHSPGSRVAIHLTWGPRQVELRVEQPYAGPPPTANGGLGLLGMAERARLLGGWLRAGYEDAGQDDAGQDGAGQDGAGHDGAGQDGAGLFVVRACLPYEPAGARP